MNISITGAVIVTIFFQVTALAQSVVSNPYSTFYDVKGHWTDGLKWENVIAIQDIQPTLDSERKVDSTLLHETMKDISKAGGGVIYFPAGEYYFDFDVKLSEGVILRGEEPSVMRLACDSSFRPATHFIFPKYYPSFSGLGTPNTTAFKKIYIDDTGKENFGLVYIDINRAMIDFYLDATEESHNNVIVFGVRQNNAARPEDEIPSIAQINKGNGWQRWPSGRANIAVCAREKCVISNCRLNDAITDNFEQLNYMTNDGYVFKDQPVVFSFSYHIGISIHRRNKWQYPGVELFDNYILGSRDFPRIEVFGEAIDIKRYTLAFPAAEPQSSQILRDNYSRTFADQMNDVFKYDEYVGKSDTLHYQLLAPEKIDPSKEYPLFVFFHGNGERSKNSYRLKHLMPMFLWGQNRKQFPCYVLVPHCQEDEYWGAQSPNDDPTAIMQMVFDLMDKIKKDYKVDRDRIYIAGISEGGKAVWEMALRYPKDFAAIVSIASIWPFDEDQLKTIKKTPVWISTGKLDSHVPVEYVREMNRKLLKAGLDVKYQEYPNIAHLSWIPLSFDENFLPWLFSKKRR